MTAPKRINCEDHCCPYAFTNESEQVQNYGCLPTPHEFVRIYEETGHILSCHEDGEKACVGFARYMKEHGTPLKSSGIVVSNPLWQEKGADYAIGFAEGRAHGS